MKEIKTYLITLLIIAILIKLYKVVLCLIGVLIITLVIAIIVAFINDYYLKKRLKKFRKENSGGIFLWYSTNKKYKQIIETTILPNIKCEIIYNNKSKVLSRLNDDEIRYLRRETEPYKFPIIIKIEEHEIKSVSAHRDVLNYKEKIVSLQELISAINQKIEKL